MGGWWNKIRLFQALTVGTTLFLDLDTCATGPLESIAGVDSSFAALRDFYRPDRLGSGVMVWNGDHSDIWRDWKKEGKPKLAGGDQQWIDDMRPFCDRLQDKVPGKIVTYKPLGHDPSTFLKEVPKGASIVCFHGQPKPHEVNGWVKELWRE